MWTPRSKKGDLKFTLDGYKLKGSWVLVRTSGRYAGSRGGERRSWLLIKHRDDWSGDLDIAEFAPMSVKSDGDFEDILASDAPDVWLSNRPAKGGETGALLADIIERGLKLKAERQAAAPPRRRASAKTQPPAKQNVAASPRRERASERRQARGGGAPRASKTSKK